MVTYSYVILRNIMLSMMKIFIALCCVRYKHFNILIIFNLLLNCVCSAFWQRF